MKTRLFLVLLGATLGLNGQTTRQTAAAGNWSNPSTWQNGLPVAGDAVVINHNVVYDVSNGSIADFLLSGISFSVSQVTVNNAELTIDGEILAVQGGISMNNAQIKVQNTGVLSIDAQQNATLDGTLDLDGGLLVLQSQAGVTIQCNANIFVRRLSAIVGLQSSSFNSILNDTVVFESGSALIGHPSGNYTINTGPLASITFKHGSQYFQSPNVNFIGDPNAVAWEIDFSPNLLGWRQVCSPISGGTLADLEDDLPLYFDNPLQANAYYWDASKGQQNKAVGWVFSTSRNEPFDPSRAYSIYAGPPYYPFQSGGTLDITGISPAVSNYTYDIYNYSDPLGQGNSAKDRGWNLVPNPYTAALNVSKMVEDPDFPCTYKAAHVWDAVRKQYIAILGNGVSNEIDHSSNNAVVADEKYIMPFQSFWVKMNPNDATQDQLIIKSEYRTLSPVFTNHFKTASVNFPIPVQAWNLADSTVDQVTFNIDTAGTQSFEPARDAFKVFSLEANVPSLFTVEQDSLFPLSVQTLAVNGTQTVPLHFTTNTPGSYAIRLGAAVQGMSQVDLVDLKTNQTHNLQAGPYSFIYDATFGDHRFNLVFGGNSIGMDEAVHTHNGIHFGQNSAQWQVNLPNPGVLTLVDLSGRVVHAENVEAGVHTRQKAEAGVPVGVYLLVVQSGGQAMTFKVLH